MYILITSSRKYSSFFAILAKPLTFSYTVITAYQTEYRRKETGHDR
nr:MAG TPA: hypothetical protein [Caudoviricetes sp.]